MSARKACVAYQAWPDMTPRSQAPGAMPSARPPLILASLYARFRITRWSNAGAYGMPTVTTRRQASSLYEMPSEHLPRYTQNNRAEPRRATALL